jgi:hypothetical protein
MVPSVPSLWILLTIAQALPSSGVTPSPSATVPRFEHAACPVDVARGERIDCGVLTVAENRRKASCFSR